MWFPLRSKTVFVDIHPFYWFDQKQLLKKNNFLQDWPLFKLVEKNKLYEY